MTDPETRQVKMTMSATLAVPEGCEVAHARTGIPVGMRLPDGRIVKPFVAYEIVDSEESDDPEEISEDELLQIGVAVVEDHDRVFEGLD